MATICVKMSKSIWTLGIDMNDSRDGIPRCNDWGRTHKVYQDQWLHSDMKDMAYFYVYPMFYRLQEKEDPNEANTD